MDGKLTSALLVYARLVVGTDGVTPAAHVAEPVLADLSGPTLAVRVTHGLAHAADAPLV